MNMLYVDEAGAAPQQPSLAHAQGKKVSRSLTRAFDAAHGRAMCGSGVYNKQDVTQARASLRQHTTFPTTNQAIARALCLHDLVAVQHLSCGNSNRLQYLKAQELKVRSRASQSAGCFSCTETL